MPHVNNRLTYIQAMLVSLLYVRQALLLTLELPSALQKS